MKNIDRRQELSLLLARKTIPDLIAVYEKLLYEDYLPFVEKYVYDSQNGGFKWNTTYSGQNLSTDKRTWYDARGAWVYAYLYAYMDKEEHFLDKATQTVSLLLKVNEDEKELWPWAYKEEGQPIADEEPDIYGNLFVAEALSMYSKAGGKPQYWEKAKNILLQCWKRYENPDYVYNLPYSPDPAFKKAPVVLGHWMIFLRVCTGLLKIKEDSRLKEIADQCIEALINKHQVEPHCLMLEVLGKDFKPIKGKMSEFVYIGHAIEALWMLMDEADRRGDEDLFDKAAKRFRRHVEVAWDDVFGGVFHCLNHIGNNEWDLNKVLWAQHETLVGLLILIEKKKDPWAIDFYTKMFDYLLGHFMQKDRPFRPWKIGGNRFLSEQEEGNRIENYHHPRGLMLGLYYLNKLKQRN